MKFALTPPGQRTAVLEHFEQDLRQIAARRENRPKGWGIVPSVMQDAITEVRSKPREVLAARTRATEEAPTEQQRRQWEATLKDPNASDEEKRLARLCLGLEDPGRKPAESEPRAKAQKAGQG